MLVAAEVLLPLVLVVVLVVVLVLEVGAMPVSMRIPWFIDPFAGF
jgi:hypothetical protein